MNRDKPCHNSFCEPAATGRRSKKTLTDRTDAHGVFDHGFFWPLFFDLYLDFIRICKRCRLRLLRKWRMKNEEWRINIRRPEGKPIIQFRIPCQLVNSSTSKKNFFLFFCPHTLTFRLKRPVYRGFKGEGKCEGKLSPLTLALTPKSVWNPSCPVKVQSISKENQNINQKEKIKKKKSKRKNQKTNPCKDSVINQW